MTTLPQTSVPAVSVIIPAYRITEYIAETLDSVLAQTFRDYEIIVVNDGCPDTEALERALEPYRDRIVYLKQENAGPSSARNTGIRAARADLIAFLDGDDVWEPNYLEFQLGMMRADPSIDILYPNGIFVGGTHENGRPLMEFSVSEGEVTFAKLARLECNVIVSVTARREILERVGLFNPAFRKSEDFDLWLRVAAAGGRIAYHREKLLRYRRRDTSASADLASMRQAAIDVLSHLDQTLDLSSSDRQALREAAGRLRADLAYFQAYDALDRGDAAGARQGFQTANEYYRRPKLSILILALRWVPRLAASFARRGR